MKTFYLYGAAGAIQVPNRELQHLAKGQETIPVRGFQLVHAVKDASGSYIGYIKISQAERCKEGLCDPRRH